MLEDKLLFFFKDLLDDFLVVFGQLLDVVCILHIKLVEGGDAISEFFFLGSCLLWLILLLLLVPVLSALKELACSTCFAFVFKLLLTTKRGSLTHASGFSTASRLLESTSRLPLDTASCEEIFSIVSTWDSINHGTEKDLLVVRIAHGFSRIHRLISTWLLVL